MANSDEIIEISNGHELKLKIKLKEQSIEFNNILCDVKGAEDGRGIPLIKETKSDAKLKCNCESIIISRDYDCQCMDKTLYFARCEKHHVTTWGYQTKGKALKAWKDGIVTNNYNFCKVIYE